MGLQVTRDKYIQVATLALNSKELNTDSITPGSIKSMEEWAIDPALVDSVKVRPPPYYSVLYSLSVAYL